MAYPPVAEINKCNNYQIGHIVIMKLVTGENVDGQANFSHF